MQGDSIHRLTRGGLNLIQAALTIFDDDLRLLLANTRFAQMFDLPSALAHEGTRFEDIIRFLVERGEYGAQTDIDDAVRQRVETARAFQPHYMERERANGRWISVEGAPLPEGGWITVYTDITEIKIQEQLLRARSAELSDRLLTNAERLSAANRELASTNAALAEAQRELMAIEARTRLVMETTPAHIAHINSALVYTYSNRRMSHLMPGTPQNVVGLHASVALGAGTFAQIAPHMQRALAGESTICEITHEESGRRIRVALTPDAATETTSGGAYILSTDITEETQARAALMQSRKRALAAQLTSGVAHDFSNLLTVIMGQQSRITQDPDAPPRALEAARATLAAARRGGDLLRRIGDIAGDRQIRPVATDLPALIRAFSELAAPLLDDSISLLTRVETGLEYVLVDPGMIQDCLLNLLLNARDAIRAHEGTPPHRIEINFARVRDTWLQITVADTGPGFSAQALGHAFDPFFTTKGGEGSGLGLAMVFDQVSICGGSVRLGNEAGRGARVTLRLPLRLAAPTNTADGHMAHGNTADGRGAPTAHLILLVEDDPDIRAHVRDMLCADGHQVVEADNAADAQVLAHLPEVSMILSDVQLPGGMDGPALLDWAATATPLRRLALMTALPPADARRQAAEARFPVLGKPIDAAALASLIASLPVGAPLLVSKDAP